MTELFHGSWWYHRQEKKPEELIPGRFTQLLPDLKTAHSDGRDLERLAEEMTAHQEDEPTPEGKPDPEEDSEITAAYTYLGQFVDHDLTFDPTSTLREFLNPDQIAGLKDYRTPRLDLDNLYGRGPDATPGPSGGRELCGHELRHRVLEGRPHQATSVPPVFVINRFALNVPAIRNRSWFG